MKAKRIRRRHVIAEGWVGEWNLPPSGTWASSDEGRNVGRRVELLPVILFERAWTIAGAKRRVGQRARRVRVVVEEIL